MIGIFNRKARTTPPQPAALQAPMEGAAELESPSSGAVFKVFEWDAAIERVRRHFEASIARALQESEACLANMQLDVSDIDRIWKPLEHELSRSQRTLIDSWTSTSVTLGRDPSVHEHYMRVQEAKLHEHCSELDLSYHAALRQVRARAGHAVLQFAMHQDARYRYCGGCSHALVSVLIAHVQNLLCPHCGFVQIAEPGKAFHTFAAVTARWIGEWDAFTHYQVMKRSEIQIGRYRETQGVPMPLLHDYHNAGYAYWQTLLGVEAHFVPHLARELPRQHEANMKDVRDLLRNHPQWRAYERGSL